MKKVILFFLLVCVASFGQSFTGLKIGGGPTVTVYATGTAAVWDEQFDGSAVSTSTWGISILPGSTVTQTGDGYMRITAVGPWNGTNMYDVSGLYRPVYGDFTAIVKMNYAPFENFGVAGIMAAAADGRRGTVLWKEYSTGEVIWRRDAIDTLDTDTAQVAFTADDFYLKIVRSGVDINTFHSVNGADWTEVTNTTEYHPMATSSVTLTLFSAKNTTGGSSNATATFDYCTITFP